MKQHMWQTLVILLSTLRGSVPSVVNAILEPTKNRVELFWPKDHAFFRCFWAPWHRFLGSAFSLEVFPLLQSHPWQSAFCCVWFTELKFCCGSICCHVINITLFILCLPFSRPTQSSLVIYHPHHWIYRLQMEKNEFWKFSLCQSLAMLFSIVGIYSSTVVIIQY